MTREEAINKLVNARYADEFQGDEELTTAHLMAIKALEQESVLDKIRAEIEPTRKMYLEMNDIDWLNGCDYVLSIIDKYKGESED